VFGIEHYTAFVLAGILLNLTPGADTLYILTRSIAQGRKAGLYSVLGISTGCLVHTSLAAFGLSLILRESVLAYSIVQYAGAGYLLYLGVRAILDKKNPFVNQAVDIGEVNYRSIYTQAVLTNVLNPKVALFFLSFLPQFIDPRNPYGAIPFLILGCTFLTTGTLWCFCLAFFASRITKAMRENRGGGRILQKISGIIFLGLGLRIALIR
jgi:threonine/homoserine/homoserine lactone efflux protein